MTQDEAEFCGEIGQDVLASIGEFVFSEHPPAAISWTIGWEGKEYLITLTPTP